nr:hypothetical protein [Tanacetum cinerariifolium]
MGDANHIRTLGDYSKPSHEGYRNTIELLVGNNVDCKAPQRYLDAPTTSWRISLRSMDSFQGWDEPVDPEEGSRNNENPVIEQLLGVMKYKVDALMKDAISLFGRSEGVFRMTSNEIYQLPPEPSCLEEFEHIVMNFILDQKERVKQLEEYMKVIVGDFMQLSLKVTRRVKEKIRKEGSRMRNIEKITKYPDMEAPKPLVGHKFPENPKKKGTQEDNPSPLKKSHWKKRSEDSECSKMGTDPFSGPQWGNLFRVNEPIYRELARELFASFEFEASACRVGLYTERRSKDNATLNGLSRAETVKAHHLLMEFWLTIRDGGFNVGNTRVTSIRDHRVKLAYRCIREKRNHPHRSEGKEFDLWRDVCYYDCKPATRAMEGEEEAEEEAEGEGANEGADASAEMYQNMSQGDWQEITYIIECKKFFKENEKKISLRAWRRHQDSS